MRVRSTGIVERRFSLDLLRRKCGARSSLRRFRQSLRAVVKHRNLLDYAVIYEADEDMVTFQR